MLRPVAITRRSVPPAGASGRVFCRLRLRSGSALPAPQAPENFLILIVGRSHLDCRAAGTPFQTFQAGNLLTLLANHLGQRGNLTEQINQQSFKLWPGQAGKGNRRRWHMMQRLHGAESAQGKNAVLAVWSG